MGGRAPRCHVVPGSAALLPVGGDHRMRGAFEPWRRLLLILMAVMATILVHLQVRLFWALPQARHFSRTTCITASLVSSASLCRGSASASPSSSQPHGRPPIIVVHALFAFSFLVDL